MGRPIIQHQAIAFMLADMAISVESARNMVWKSCWTKDQGLRNSYFASMAKALASEAAVANADRAVQIFGGMGYNKESPVEKLYRDAKIYMLYEVSSVARAEHDPGHADAPFGPLLRALGHEPDPASDHQQADRGNVQDLRQGSNVDSLHELADPSNRLFSSCHHLRESSAGEDVIGTSLLQAVKGSARRAGAMVGPGVEPRPISTRWPLCPARTYTALRFCPHFRC